MSLTTGILAYKPVPIEPLFRFCQTLLGDPAEQIVERHAAGDEYEWSHWSTYSSHMIQNQPGQGLDAILKVEYGADGPLVDEERELPGVPVILISFDTAYSWDSPRPGGHIDLPGGPGVHAGAGDLHAYLVTRVVEYLTERGSPYAWHLEGRGEWFANSLDDLERLGDAWKLGA